MYHSHRIALQLAKGRMDDMQRAAADSPRARIAHTWHPRRRASLLLLALTTRGRVATDSPSLPQPLRRTRRSKVIR